MKFVGCTSTLLAIVVQWFVVPALAFSALAREASAKRNYAFIFWLARASATAFWKGICPVMTVRWPFSSVIAHWEAGGHRPFFVAHLSLPHVWRPSSLIIILSISDSFFSSSSSLATWRREVINFLLFGQASGVYSLILSLHRWMPSRAYWRDVSWG